MDYRIIFIAIIAVLAINNKELMSYIGKNYEWIFGGIGVSIIGWFIERKSRKSKLLITKNQESGNSSINTQVDDFKGKNQFIGNGNTINFDLNKNKETKDAVYKKERCAEVFPTRSLTIKYLLNGMYEKASKGDVIWGQCVNCSDYKDIKTKILNASSRGVRFKIIANSSVNVPVEFRAIYNSIKDSEVIEGDNNNLRVYGLSEKEVILAFRGFESYTGVLIKDENFVKIVKEWFDRRFEEIKQKMREKEL